MSGVTYGRTRSADLAAPFHGVRVPADRVPPETPERAIVQLAQDYAPRLRAGQYFCELTALVLFGAPVPHSRENEGSVHIGAIPPASPPRARGTRAHYSPVARTFRANGLPVCSPIEAWVECAGSVVVDELVMLGDALVRRQDPLTTMDSLRAAVASAAGRTGAADLRAAMGLVRARTDSPMETVLRLLLGRSDLPDPEVNPAVCSASGAFLGYADLMYPRWGVIVEYDGEHHFGLTQQRVDDLDRVDRFVRADYRVIQVHKEHLARDRAAVVARVRAALLERGWRP